MSFFDVKDIIENGLASGKNLAIVIRDSAHYLYKNEENDFDFTDRFLVIINKKDDETIMYNLNSVTSIRMTYMKR